MEVADLTQKEVHDIAEMVSEKTVNKLFVTLGVDVTDPSEIRKFQKDLIHLRNWRESTEAISRHGLIACVTFIVTAALGWAIYLFRHP